MKIAIIGTGNLGLSIAKGLVINNTYTALYSVSYTHLRAPRDRTRSRMPSSA